MSSHKLAQLCLDEGYLECKSIWTECPECSTIEDEQYHCITCEDVHSSGGYINVVSLIRQMIKEYNNEN